MLRRQSKISRRCRERCRVILNHNSRFMTTHLIVPTVITIESESIARCMNLDNDNLRAGMPLCFIVSTIFHLHVAIHYMHLQG